MNQSLCSGDLTGYLERIILNETPAFQDLMSALMSPRMALTGYERERLAVLVNNLAVYAAQLISASGSEFIALALSNLNKVKTENENLLKRLDQLSREHHEESVLRLIEDLGRLPTDVANMLSIVRRCLLASGFLGHLIAHPYDPQVASDNHDQETRLH